MDLTFIGLAVICLIISGPRRCLFLWLIAAEFVVSAAWIKMPFGDPWWFLSYAAQNCLFVWLVMRSRHRLASEYAGTLILSAVLATAVFIESFVGSDAIHGVRPIIMTWICVYQLWLAAAGAGLAQWTLLEGARGIASRRAGRRRGAGADNPTGNVGDGV